jgi:hypothetical protein
MKKRLKWFWPYADPHEIILVIVVLLFIMIFANGLFLSCTGGR